MQQADTPGALCEQRRRLLLIKAPIWPLINLPSRISENGAIRFGPDFEDCHWALVQAVERIVDVTRRLHIDSLFEPRVRVKRTHCRKPDLIERLVLDAEPEDEAFAGR